MRLLISFFATFSAMCGCVSNHAAQFQNGSFESRTASLTNLSIGDTTLPGWTVGGTEANISWSNRGFNSAHSLQFGPIAATSAQWIEQTFDTIPGAEYRLSFVGDGYNYDGIVGVTVTVSDRGGQTLTNRDVAIGGTASMPWISGGKFNFTALSESTTVRFTYLERSAQSATFLLDDVEITPTAAMLGITSYPAIKVAGLLYAEYRIEYAEASSPSIWKTLTTVWVNDVPPIVIDTNAPSFGSRLYRAIFVTPN